jgi:hypothetical protein
MKKITLTLKDILSAQYALQDLESKDWNIRAGRRISILSKQLVENLQAIDEGKKTLFEQNDVTDYDKLSKSKQEKIDKLYTDFLENEEVELTFSPMTDSILGDAKLKGSTYRQLYFFFEDEEEEKPTPVKPEDVAE